MRSEKPANGSHFPTAFEAFKGTPFNSEFVECACPSCAKLLRQRRRWHSPESEDIWLFGEGKLVLLCVWWQLLDELWGQVTQPAVWDPEFVFTTAAKRADVGGNKFSGVFRLGTSPPPLRLPPSLQVKMKPLCIHYWSTLLLKYKGRAMSTNINPLKDIF